MFPGQLVGAGHASQAGGSAGTMSGLGLSPQCTQHHGDVDPRVIIEGFQKEATAAI